MVIRDEALLPQGTGLMGLNGQAAESLPQRMAQAWPRNYGGN